MSLLIWLRPVLSLAKPAPEWQTWRAWRSLLVAGNWESRCADYCGFPSWRRLSMFWYSTWSRCISVWIMSLRLPLRSWAWAAVPFGISSASGLSLGLITVCEMGEICADLEEQLLVLSLSQASSSRTFLVLSSSLVWCIWLRFKRAKTSAACEWGTSPSPEEFPGPCPRCRARGSTVRIYPWLWLLCVLMPWLCENANNFSVSNTSFLFVPVAAILRWLTRGAFIYPPG